MDLLIYFALPIATIIIAAILQKILNSPILVAAFTFAVYLIVTFAAFDESFLIATLVYTLLALLTAIIVNRWETITDNDEEENTSCCNRLNNVSQEETNNSSTCGYNRFRCRRF